MYLYVKSIDEKLGRQNELIEGLKLTSTSLNKEQSFITLNMER